IAVFPTGLLAAQNSAPQTPPVARADKAQVVAAVAVGGAASVMETVSKSPLREALVPSTSMLGHAFGSPIAELTRRERIAVDDRGRLATLLVVVHVRGQREDVRRRR